MKCYDNLRSIITVPRCSMLSVCAIRVYSEATEYLNMGSDAPEFSYKYDTLRSLLRSSVTENIATANPS